MQCSHAHIAAIPGADGHQRARMRREKGVCCVLLVAHHQPVYLVGKKNPHVPCLCPVGIVECSLESLKEDTSTPQEAFPCRLAKINCHIAMGINNTKRPLLFFDTFLLGVVYIKLCSQDFQTQNEVHIYKFISYLYVLCWTILLCQPVNLNGTCLVIKH